MKPEVRIYAHFHECEARWHSYCQLSYVSHIGEEPQLATFHEWDREAGKAAAERCANLVQMFLEKNGVTDVSIQFVAA